MTRTLQQILDARARSLVGRDQELAVILALAGADRPLAAMVHGVAGVGKSTLLRAFAARARSEGATVLQLDGEAIEPTERGFLDALAGALGEPLDDLGALAGRIGALAPRTILVVDTLERLRLLDAWLRRRLLPALPDTARVLLAGRDPLPAAWAATYGELLAEVPLANLPREDAETLLREAGVAEPDVRHVNRIAHGHPLSLRLAASALAARPGLALDQAAVPAVVDELSALYLDGLDRTTRRALDAAAVVRRPTRSLLAAMLPDLDAEEAWTRLDALPFTQTGRDGLVLHDTVREAADAALRAADPERRRRLRTAAFGRLRTEVRDAGPAELWRYTSDLLFLVEDPVVREGFFPTGESPFFVEGADPEDEAAILAIVRRHEDPEGAEILTRWWEAVPEGFRVARDRAGDVAAFLLLCEPRVAGARVIGHDPLASRWREDLRRRPLPSDERVLFGRALLSRDRDGVALGAAQAALWVDAKRTYMEMRPQLRRVYIGTRRADLVAPILGRVGFTPLPGPPTDVAGTAYHSLTLDFGPRSVDGWLALLVAAELAVDPGPRLDADRREVVLGDARVALTPLEFDLVAHLHARAGRVVPRAELLREVWGYQWQGGGNVIEVAVSGIRRKLGDHAGLLDTVRGRGYRWKDA